MLVRTPLPKVTESALGYALRLSETNGYDTPWHIFNLAGFSQGKMVNAGFHVESLASVLGCSPLELAHLSYTDDTGESRAFKLLGHPLGATLVSSPLQLRKPRICPDCATQDGFIDAFWDLNAAVACPKHRREAVSVCPECGESLRWFRPGLTTCRCGADLTATEAVPVAAPLAEFMGLLMAKLHRAPLSERPNESGFPVSILDPIPLSGLLPLLGLLGEFNRQSYGDTILRPGMSDTELAIETLADWPVGYHEFLNRLGKKYIQAQPLVMGFRKQFEQFYGRMFKNMAFSEFAEPFREEFVRFGASEWGHAVVDRKQLHAKTITTTRRFVPLSEYARRHRLSSVAQTRLLADGAIVAKRREGSAANRIIVDVELSAQNMEAPSPISAREAAALMGLPVSVIEHLRDVGTFKPKLRRGYVASWHHDDVEEFLASNLAPLPFMKERPGQAISLGEVMRLKFRNAAAKATIADKVLKGEVRVFGRIGDKLSDVLIAKDDIDELTLATRVEAAGNTCSFPEAGKLTGIQPNSVVSAVSAGLLTVETFKGRARISKASIEAFNSSFVPLSKLAEELGSNSGRLWAECRKMGIAVTALSCNDRDQAQPIIAKTDAAALVDAYRAFRAARDAAEARKVPGAPHPLAEEIAASGLDLETFYAQRLQSYLDKLVETGGALPRRAGMPNKVAIARACGFGRDILYNHRAAVDLLEAFSHEERERMLEKALSPMEKLQRYLASKRDAGEPLPRSENGDINKVQISREGGFHRNLLYNNPEALRVLEEAGRT